MPLLSAVDMLRYEEEHEVLTFDGKVYNKQGKAVFNAVYDPDCCFDSYEECDEDEPSLREAVEKYLHNSVKKCEEALAFLE